MANNVSKDILNKQLKSSLYDIDDRAIVNFGLIGAKIVTVEQDRACVECKCQIPKGTLALTSSMRISGGFNRRIHRCLNCGNTAIKLAESMTDELRHEDALNDAYSDYY